MSQVNYGISGGLPTFTLELGNYAHFKEPAGDANQKARDVINKIAARELLLRNSPMVDFYRNDQDNAVLRVMFSTRTNEVDLGVFLYLLQMTWFVFLTNERSKGTFERWDPNAVTSTKPEDGPTDPHQGGVDFAKLRRDRISTKPKDRESRRIR